MRKIVALAVAALALLAPAAASAHPLGNFTVNHFTRIEPSGDRLYLRYVLDMAEIPTFQARDEVAAEGRQTYGRELAGQLTDGLSLTVAGSPVELKELGHELAFAEGVGGLRRRASRSCSTPVACRPRTGRSGLPSTTGTTPTGSAGARSSSPRPRCGPRFVERALGERHQRAARLSPGSAPEPARRP